MDFICKILSLPGESLVTMKYSPFKDLNRYAKKYSLTIFYHDGKLHKSRKCGPEIFVLRKDQKLLGHKNPGKLVNLPTGVNKLAGCKYKLNDILHDDCNAECHLTSDWKNSEDKYQQGINIWRKKSLGLNKHTIKNIRRSTRQPAIHLHCDEKFNKVYLITCDKLYFRGNRHLIN